MVRTADAIAPVLASGYIRDSGQPHITTYESTVCRMNQRSSSSLHRFHSFLRRLRAGGRSNMYGAVPYLMRRFDLDRDTAFRVVCDWVDAQDAAELSGAAGTGAQARLSGRTAAAPAAPRKRSRARS